MTEQPQSSQQAGRAPAQSADAQPTPQTGRRAAFFQNAAKISWALPLIMAAASVLVRNASRDAVVVFDVLRILVALACFLVAIVALSGVRRFGRKGILIPAIIGLLLNGLLLSVAATNFINAYNRAGASRVASLTAAGASILVGAASQSGSQSKAGRGASSTTASSREETKSWSHAPSLAPFSERERVQPAVEAGDEHEALPDRG